LTSQLAKKTLTWRSYRTNTDPDDIFTVNLDTTNTETEATKYVTLNRAGLYHITASIARDGTGFTDVTVCGLILTVKYPTKPDPTEIEYAYQESGMTDFTTFLTHNMLRVPAGLIGVKIAIEIKTRAGSGNTIVRGYNYTDNKFDAGSDGSFLEITYLGL